MALGFGSSMSITNSWFDCTLKTSGVEPAAHKPSRNLSLSIPCFLCRIRVWENSKTQKHNLHVVEASFNLNKCRSLFDDWFVHFASWTHVCDLVSHASIKFLEAWQMFHVACGLVCLVVAVQFQNPNK